MDEWCAFADTPRRVVRFQTKEQLALLFFFLLSSELDNAVLAGEAAQVSLIDSQALGYIL